MADRRAGLLVQIAGVGYTTVPEGISWDTVPVGRQSVDQGAGPGETSLSNETIWRRSREDGIEGAGQDNADLLDNESSRLRFRSSVGVDPWTRRQWSLLHTTVHSLTSANTNLKMVVANQGGVPYLFTLDGTALKRSSAPLTAAASYTTLTGGGGTYTDITTDGQRVWVCNGTDVYKVDSGTVLASFSTVDCDIIGYANGRLLGAKGNDLFELDSTGTKIDVFPHPSTLFVWDGIVSSPAGIYCFGHQGDKSEVYVVTAIDGTGALDVPFFAGGLPDGETLRCLTFYVGVMVLGTSRGLRLAVITGGGFLSFGPVITQPGDVRCLEPQGEDVWFGWSNLTGNSSSGLGRARLSRFTADLVPAFTSDLQAAGVTANTLSAVTFGTSRVFAVSGSGIWAEASTFVASGTVDFGWFTFGIPEPKLIDSVAVWTDGLPGSTSVTTTVYPDDNTAGPVVTGVFNTTGGRTANFKAAVQTAAERYRVTVVLATSSSAVSPVLHRVTLRTVPKPFVSQQMVIPVILADNVDDETGARYGMDVFDQWSLLETLVKTRARTTLAVGAWSADVRLDGLQVPASGPYTAKFVDGWDDRHRFLAGKWLLTCTTLEPSG